MLLRKDEKGVRKLHMHMSLPRRARCPALAAREVALAGPLDLVLATGEVGVNDVALVVRVERVIVADGESAGEAAGECRQTYPPLVPVWLAVPARARRAENVPFVGAASAPAKAAAATKMDVMETMVV
jgi:hypothetical protein